MHTYSIVDERLVPLFEIASDSGLAVFVHCGALSVGVRKNWAFRASTICASPTRSSLHPVALHFPKIRFVVPHFGAGLLREALMLADLCPNVYSGYLEHQPLDGIRRIGLTRRVPAGS